MSSTTFQIAFLAFASLLVYVAGQSDVTKASCVIAAHSGVGAVQGVINFTQPTAGGNVTLEVHVTGFPTSVNTSLHGFHVHVSGNLTTQCNDSLGHFNPTNVEHGAPTDTVRHVGDLGNVVVDTSGVVRTTIVDGVISLQPGDHSIINRAIVVHSGEDDLGRGNQSDSKTTGHAGSRLGCCLITLDPTSTVSSTTVHTGDATVTLPLLMFTLIAAAAAAAGGGC